MVLGRTICALLLVSCLGSAATIVQDPSFEAPNVLGAYWYRPLGTAWTFTGSAGIAADGSGFDLVGAPDGDQAAFIQVTTGYISQTLTGLTVGDTYDVSFESATRPDLGLPPLFWGGEEDFNVLWNGNVIGYFSPTSTNFSEYYTNSFLATSTTGTLAFQGVDSLGGDRSAFIDSVQVANDPPVPEPSTGLTVLLGIGFFGFALRRRSLAH